MNNLALEIATFSVTGALTAQAAGADRIEFCENPEEGGTTPSYGALKHIRKKVTIPVFPIIRPRGGDFLYTADEFEMMQEDVLLCRNLGFEGVVLGLLLKDGYVDKERTSHLVELAYPMEVTFHRAFDRCKNPLESLGTIIDCGCQRILTSGQFPSALDGANLIKQLVDKADNRIIIMPGSGVTSKNLEILLNKTGASEFHASARIPIKTLMDFEVDRMNESLSYMGVNETEVKALKVILSKLLLQLQ
ncbi:copper homeostasis protein CutC [soil metagenome]